MSRQDHTPGPWVIGAIESGQFAIDGADGKDVTGWIDSEANARLIAAAPDLLEALQGLEDAYCRAGGGLTRTQRNEDRKRLIQARAAIAKATGETR